MTKPNTRRTAAAGAPGPARGAIRNQSQVQSRVNGLLINIPTDARGIIGRFASQGGNELVFAPISDKQKAVEEAEVKMTPIDDASNTAAAAADNDIA